MIINGSAINTASINGSAGGQLTLSVPISIDIFETLTLTVPVTIVVVYQLHATIAITGLSLFQSLSIPVSVNVFAKLTLTVPLSIAIHATQLTLTVPININVIAKTTLVVPINLNIYSSPVVSGVVTVPSNNSQLWKLRVLLDSTDISSRLTGSISIDAEEGSAIIAVFAIKPSGGTVDPYSWVKAPVHIFYQALDATGSVTYELPLFNGIVDTPVYSTTTRVTEFTCTDDLQNKLNKMTHANVDTLTPLSKWSKYVYDVNVDSWSYLQQRLETYPYVVDLNINGAFRAYNWSAGSVAMEFNESTILDNSLTPTLANTKDIINQVTVSLTAQHDVYRETVINIGWDQDFGPGNLDYFFATPQMICDAVNNTGAFFHNLPKFDIIPATKDMQQGTQHFVFTNFGTELLAISMDCQVIKRFTQSISSESKIVVQSDASVSGLGVLPDTVSTSITVVIDTNISTLFTETQQLTRYQCTAQARTPMGTPTAAFSDGDPYLAIQDGQGNSGFASYPRLPYTFSMYADNARYALTGSSASINQYTVNGTTSTIDINDYRVKVPDGTTGDFTVTGATPANVFSGTGEFIYDFNSFITEGTQPDRLNTLEVLKAKASTTVLSTHRKNRVTFTTFTMPLLSRGITIRVNTSTVIATGVVSQVVHNFNIDNGTATTNVGLSLSSSKSIGLSSTTGALPASLTAATVPTAPVATGYYYNLPNHLHTGAVDPNWVGHVTPTSPYQDLTHTFVAQFPEVPATNTSNSANVISGSPINVQVPQDELQLFA